MELHPQRLKEQHSYPIQEVSVFEFTDEMKNKRLMEIDVWMDVLFVQMDADYHSMHRLPKKLEF